MKLGIASLSAIVLAATLSGQAHAENEDACGAIICLYGEATGNSGGGACRPYLAKYFAIQVFHHGFSGSRTADARRDFLNECKQSDPVAKQVVGDRYGKQRNGP